MVASKQLVCVCGRLHQSRGFAGVYRFSSIVLVLYKFLVFVLACWYMGVGLYFRQAELHREPSRPCAVVAVCL
mgnify:CR=1 FL=1